MTPTTLAHVGDPIHALLYFSPVLLVVFGLWFAGRHVPDDEDVSDDDRDDGWL